MPKLTLCNRWSIWGLNDNSESSQMPSPNQTFSHCSGECQHGLKVLFWKQLLIEKLSLLSYPRQQPYVLTSMQCVPLCRPLSAWRISHPKWWRDTTSQRWKYGKTGTFSVSLTLCITLCFYCQTLVFLFVFLLLGVVKSCSFSLWSSAAMIRRKFWSKAPLTLSESALLSNRLFRLLYMVNNLRLTMIF